MADKNASRRLILLVILAAAVEILGVWLWCNRADAADWSPPQYSCVPTLSDFDHAYRIKDAVVAGVFWCDQPDGLQTFWVSGTAPGAITPKTQADALLQIAGKDPEELLKRVVVRESTPSEMEIVAQIEIAHAPHCYVTGTSATAAVLTQTAQGTLGPAKLDASGVGIRVAVGAPVGCNYRLAKETLKRYCSAENLTDTKGRRIEGDAWSACKIERAPAEGWRSEGRTSLASEPRQRGRSGPGVPGQAHDSPGDRAQCGCGQRRLSRSFDRGEVRAVGTLTGRQTVRRQRPTLTELQRWQQMIAQRTVDIETAARAIGCSLQSLRGWLLMVAPDAR